MYLEGGHRTALSIKTETALNAKIYPEGCSSRDAKSAENVKTETSNIMCNLAHMASFQLNDNSFNTETQKAQSRKRKRNCTPRLQGQGECKIM
jgi:hypothetical protein